VEMTRSTAFFSVWSSENNLRWSNRCFYVDSSVDR